MTVLTVEKPVKPRLCSVCRQPAMWVVTNQRKDGLKRLPRCHIHLPGAALRLITKADVGPTGKGAANA